MQCFKSNQISDYLTLLLGVLTTFLGQVGSEATSVNSPLLSGADITAVPSFDTTVIDEFEYSTEKTEQVTLSAADLKTEIVTSKAEKKELSGRRTTTTTTPPPPSSETVLYRLDSDSGGACILLRVDALLGLKYTTKLGERLERDIYIPDNVDISGDCSKEDDAQLVLKWNLGFKLIWRFSKTPGGERWFVETIELLYDSADRHLEHIKHTGRFALSTPHSHSSLMFPTPVGQAFTCKREVEIKLTNSAVTDTEAMLFLRDLQIQPFIFKNEFGPAYPCPAIGAGSYRSETAPLIVGSTLAAACLCTITGYSIFRYFKIKKVQYDTME